ncbi:MAG TPA: hypothetical protein VKE40_10730 [Gemmataceae bacterium]|nr:hypothetical protein [Gemmataceae bacterium]
MQAYQIQLRQLLEDHGWEVVGVLESDDWWADEFWKIESRRNAWGLAIVLTFLVDPMWDASRKKGQGVWAIGATERVPTERPSAERGIAELCIMKGRFNEKLAAFVDALDEYRNGSVSAKESRA